MSLPVTRKDGVNVRIGMIISMKKRKIFCFCLAIVFTVLAFWLTVENVTFSQWIKGEPFSEKAPDGDLLLPVALFSSVVAYVISLWLGLAVSAFALTFALANYDCPVRSVKIASWIMIGADTICAIIGVILLIIS